MTLSQLLARKNSAAAPTAVVLSYDADTDAAVRQAWNYTLEDWAGMTDQQRVFARWNISKAPNFLSA